MKNFFVLGLLLFTMQGYSQKIDGFYKGVLNNDSANKMVQEYELAIAMYKGKITGYSYVTFIVQDTFYYGIRKVKGEIVGDSIVVTDDKFVSNNFPENPAKGVKRTITIPLNGQDSLTVLSGKWKTNQTKRYYSVPGSIELAKSGDSTNSPLINHLKELGIVSTENVMVTAAETKTQADKTEEVKPVVKTEEAVAVSPKKKDKKENNKSKEKTETVKENSVANNETAKLNNQQNQQTEQVVDVKEQSTAKQETKKKKKEIITPEAKETVARTVQAATDTSAKTQPVNTENKVTKTAAIQSGSKKEAVKAVVTPEKIAYQQRGTINTKTVDVVSDSITLAFYDNGVVDGDSISVYLNGDNIVSNTKLTTVATKRVIHFDSQDEVKLVLVAENLGSIPPNTGLMSIRDGDNIFQVHFSADMQTNASIIIRRKKN